MIKLGTIVALVIVTLLLAACNQAPVKQVDYSAQLDAITTNVSNLSNRVTDNGESIASVNSQLATISGSVSVIANQAQELASVPAAMSNMVRLLDLVNPKTTGIVSVAFEPPLDITVTTGACTGDEPQAIDTRPRDVAREVAFIGLTAGPACLQSADPPAQMEVQVKRGQMLSLYFSPPTPTE